MKIPPSEVVVALSDAGWKLDGPDPLGVQCWIGPGKDAHSVTWGEALHQATSKPRAKPATETTEFWMTAAGTAGAATAMVATLGDAGQALGQPWAGIVVVISQVSTVAIPILYAWIRAKAKSLEAQQ